MSGTTETAETNRNVVTDGGSPGSNPRSQGGKDGLQKDQLNKIQRLIKMLRAYLPTGAEEPEEGYTGILSYSVEWHVVLIGLSVGITAATTGDVQRAFALVSIALGMGRVTQQASEKVESQLVKEPWYFIAGVAVGYAVVEYGLPAATEMGIGVAA